MLLHPQFAYHNQYLGFGFWKPQERTQITNIREAPGVVLRGNVGSYMRPKQKINPMIYGHIVRSDYSILSICEIARNALSCKIPSSEDGPRLLEICTSVNYTISSTPPLVPTPTSPLSEQKLDIYDGDYEERILGAERVRVSPLSGINQQPRGSRQGGG